MKSVSLISKRNDFTSKEFRNYYESTHCLKAMKYFPYRRYVRNYPVSGGESLDFDCISEFELDLDPSTRDIANSGSRKRMVEDERNFMKPECIRFAPVREHVLLEADKEAASPGEEASPDNE